MSDNFWSWMLRVYPRPGVSEALIALQDEDDLNVNALLFCCWLGVRGGRLTRQQASEVERLSRDWAYAIVAPIRTARRLLKTSDLITDERRADIRKRVQGIEMELEEIHGLLLQTRAAPDLAARADEPEAREELAKDNARQYLAARALSAADQDRILAGVPWRTISSAVCAD